MNIEALIIRGTKIIFTKMLSLSLLTSLLVSCGSGGSSGGGTQPPPEPETNKFSVSITNIEISRLDNDEAVEQSGTIDAGAEVTLD